MSNDKTLSIAASSIPFPNGGLGTHNDCHHRAPMVTMTKPNNVRRPLRCKTLFPCEDTMRKLESYCGDIITNTIAKAIEEATKHKEQVGFDFNGVDVIVEASSDPTLIYRDWSRGLNGYLGDKPIVGPFPKAELLAEEIASDAAIKAEHDRKSGERQAEYAKKQAEQTAALNSALSEAGSLELLDAEGWKKTVDANKDGYGGRVIRYAEEWGRLMQTRIAKGETVAQCAEEASRLADDDGITGFMYGCAVSILSKVWRHGEELRRWHNTKTQIGTEGDKANESGGVLNPALLSVG